MIPLELLDRPQRRVGQLDEDELLVVIAGILLLLLGQSIAPSAQGGHLETKQRASQRCLRLMVALLLLRVVPPKARTKTTLRIARGAVVESLLSALLCVLWFFFVFFCLLNRDVYCEMRFLF